MITGNKSLVTWGMGDMRYEGQKREIIKIQGNFGGRRDMSTILMMVIAS